MGAVRRGLWAWVNPGDAREDGARFLSPRPLNARPRRSGPAGAGAGREGGGGPAGSGRCGPRSGTPAGPAPVMKTSAVPSVRVGLWHWIQPGVRFDMYLC